MIVLGVNLSKIVFLHQIKSINSLKFANKKGICKLVYENANELKKILKYHPYAEVFMRIKPTFSKAIIQFSNKFGTDEKDVQDLLQLTSDLGANFIGFSFHVGSLCDDLTTFRIVLEYVSRLKQEAEDLGLKVSFIDIGGGFLPLKSKSRFTFIEIANAIKSTIHEFFEDEEDIKFIAEPGRYIGNDYLDLHLPVISVKIREKEGILHQDVYIPDGMYGAFNALTYDHVEPHFEINTNGCDDELITTTLWGQTCDSADVIYVDLQWPKLEVGDMLTINHFGAYTFSPTSFFNGFYHHKVFVLGREEEFNN
jgi:ornithine decarboxylase